MIPRTDRRNFLKIAALTGATAFTGSRLASAAQAPETAAGKNADVTPSIKGAVPLAPPDRQPPNLEVPEPVDRKIGWAVVGLGQLAIEEVMPAFGQCRYSRPVALVSGHPEKARKVAGVYGIEQDAIYDYENYDRLKDDPRVDVIYIILPNSMHAEYTIRGLRAGKHVLCEKPMSVTVAEAQQMIAASRDTHRKLAVAYRLHYEPLNRAVMDLCEKKAHGPIKTFESSNCQDVQAPNIRLSARLGGGPVGDVGVYSINAARYVIREEPSEVVAFAHQPNDDPRFREVPESVAFTMRYPSGVLAHCDCSFGTAESRRYRVHCADGFIEMDPAFSYRGLQLHVMEGDTKKGTGRKSRLLIPEVNHFAAEMDHFSQCILQNKDTRTPGSMGLADMRIIAAIDHSVKTGEIVRMDGFAG